LPREIEPEYELILFHKIAAGMIAKQKPLIVAKK